MRKLNSRFERLFADSTSLEGFEKSVHKVLGEIAKVHKIAFVATSA